MIAKLFSYRDTDRQDIIKDTVVQALDWELLDQIARSDEEVKLNALNERNYQDFLYNYEEYKPIPHYKVETMFLLYLWAS